MRYMKLYLICAKPRSPIDASTGCAIDSLAGRDYYAKAATLSISSVVSSEVPY